MEIGDSTFFERTEFHKEINKNMGKYFFTVS